ncbi:MAG: hypothetical protein CM1200mP16_05620 [Nitrospina sp.]|nr:MAG: hypothetical protein CM1200mP16_05620 [Nitrospina sp.]
MVIRPLKNWEDLLRKMERQKFPEIKSNTEIKQLGTAITVLTEKLNKREKFFSL